MGRENGNGEHYLAFDSGEDGYATHILTEELNPGVFLEHH
jgi:hypothetical protein